jgi:hypothetical protein
METLTALFGRPIKVKLLRLFLFSGTTPLFAKEISTHSKCTPAMVKKELNLLVKADLVKKKIVSKDVQVTRGKKTIVNKVKGVGYVLNDRFPYLEPLKNLLTIASIRPDEALAKRIAAAGRIKLLIAAGVFIQNWESRVDLLIVGEEINLAKVDGIIKTVESEIGKEISYSAFDTTDFEYRLGIHDRLIRDILDYPHVTLIDKLGIAPS